jgi:hypothetical protein
MKQNVHTKKINLLKIIDVHKEGDLPLACFTNLRSASLRLGSQLSPVQSKEWEDSQSASAHDMLHVFITLSDKIISYFTHKKMKCKNKYPINHRKLQLISAFI